MKRDDWKRIEACVRGLAPRPASDRFEFSDADIVLTFLWGCYFEKPVRWSCRRHNWPVYHTRPIPGESTMSRRLRTPSVLALFEAARVVLEAADPGGLVRVIDGKILPIASHSRDPDAGFGGPRGRRRGYEMHSICTLSGQRNAWDVRSLSVDERVVARDLVAQAAYPGYLLGDSNYHSEPLAQVCDRHGVQLAAPRKQPGRGLGHCPLGTNRRRALEITEFNVTPFAADLFKQRRTIETMHANLASSGSGLHGLPAWVRRLHRVRPWVAGKLLLDAARRVARSQSHG